MEALCSLKVNVTLFVGQILRSRHDLSSSQQTSDGFAGNSPEATRLGLSYDVSNMTFQPDVKRT